MGSGFPFLSPDRWLEGWAGLDADSGVDEAVRCENAARLFGL
jgi:predicted TIM-barrel fold metal-dependent hydrolase